MPLPAKLAGANLLVVAVAAAVIYYVRGPDADWRVSLVATVALATALALNVLLVSLALKPLRELERTAWEVWAGNLESRVPPSTIADAELRRVSSTLNYLVGELAQDRARARSLASAVVQATDRERARVGHELHDSIAQSVAALRFQLMAIEHEVFDPAVAEKLSAMRVGTGELLEEIKLLSLSTHPRLLDDLGLVPALRHLTRAQDADTLIELSVAPEADGELAALPRDVAALLYGVAQQAIGNAIRHASPRRVDVTLGLADGAILMQIADDGSGFDLDSLDSSQPTSGIFAMRERTALANGVFEIASTPGDGTSVHVRVPTRRATRPAPSIGIAP